MNILISVKGGISLCVYNGSEYPLVNVTSENAIIACTTEQSAENIAIRTNGSKHNTPESEFPYEVRIPLDRFEKIIEQESWYEIVNKYFID